MFNSFLYAYQRVNLHVPMVFLWFSYGFPMVFLWFSYGSMVIFHSRWNSLTSPRCPRLPHRDNRSLPRKCGRSCPKPGIFLDGKPMETYGKTYGKPMESAREFSFLGIQSATIHGSSEISTMLSFAALDDWRYS